MLPGVIVQGTGLHLLGLCLGSQEACLESLYRVRPMEPAAEDCEGGTGHRKAWYGAASSPRRPCTIRDETRHDGCILGPRPCKLPLK